LAVAAKAGAAENNKVESTTNGVKAFMRLILIVEKAL
jgi:hypothetical protein